MPENKFDTKRFKMTIDTKNKFDTKMFKMTIAVFMHF